MIKEKASGMKWVNSILSEPYPEIFCGHRFLKL